MNTDLQFSSIKDNIWFILTVMLFVVQYAQPEESFHFLKSIKPHVIFVAVVGLFLFFSRYNIFQWKYPQMKVFWLFLAYMIILYPFSTWMADTAKLMITYMFMFSVFISSLIITVNNEKKLRIFTTTLVFCGAFIAVHGILTAQFIDGDIFFIGTGNYLTDPNDFSLFMNMMIPFSYFAMLREKRIFMKLIYLFVTGLFIAGVVISFSRGGFLGLIGVMLVIFYFSPYKKRTLSVLAILAVIVFFATPSGWKQEMSTSTDATQGTGAGRIALWLVSIDVFLDYPLGVGVAQSPIYTFEKAQVGETPHVCHSIWFTTLTEEGIIGIILLLLLLYWCLKYLGTVISNTETQDYPRWFAISCLGSLIGFLVSGSFISVIYSPHLWYLAAFSVVVFNIHKNKEVT